MERDVRGALAGLQALDVVELAEGVRGVPGRGLCPLLGVEDIDQHRPLCRPEDLWPVLLERLVLLRVDALPDAAESLADGLHGHAESLGDLGEGLAFEAPSDQVRQRRRLNSLMNRRCITHASTRTRISNWTPSAFAHGSASRCFGHCFGRPPIATGCLPG